MLQYKTKPIVMASFFSRITCGVWMLVMLAACGYAEKKHNPYHLPLTRTAEAYEKEIRENPDTELVDLETYIPGIVLDIRYATRNNFTGRPIYSQDRAFLCRPAADALLQIQEFLKPSGVGLKIFDAYRPYAGTLRFFQVCKDTNFVAHPAHGSIHNRGCAVDLTLISLADSVAFEMPTDFDDFSEKAFYIYTKLPQQALINRTLLRNTMERYGFAHNPTEWWHFNYRDGQHYPLRDLSFELLDQVISTRKAAQARRRTQYDSLDIRNYQKIAQ